MPQWGILPHDGILCRGQIETAMSIHKSGFAIKNEIENKVDHDCQYDTAKDGNMQLKKEIQQH